MTLLRRKAEHDAAHKNARKQIEESRSQIIDMVARLVRLEAEVGIFRPFFTDDDKGRP